jgi:hypothetical protein
MKRKRTEEITSGTHTSEEKGSSADGLMFGFCQATVRRKIDEMERKFDESRKKNVFSMLWVRILSMIELQDSCQIGNKSFFCSQKVTLNSL